MLSQTLRRIVLLFVYVFCLGSAGRAATYEFLDDEAEPHFDLSFNVQPMVRGGLTVAFDWKDNLNFYTLELTPDDAALRAVVAGRPQRLAMARCQ